MVEKLKRLTFCRRRLLLTRCCSILILTFILHIFIGNEISTKINELIIGNKNVLHLPEVTQVLSKRVNGKDAIYFIESTGTGYIKSRYVCSLESAARTHPNSDIYLLIVYSSSTLDMSLNNVLLNVLNHHKNIIPLYVNMNILFKNTILEAFLNSHKLENSTFKAVHTSDVIRVYILYKYGGKYIDLDTILVKNISYLKNFIIFMYPHKTHLANGIIGLEQNSSIALKILNNIEKYWNGESWLQNGPTLLNNVMIEMCNCSISNMTTKNCKGITVLEHNVFFPIPYYDLLQFFYEDLNGKVMEKIKNVTDLLGIHISNSLVWNRTINIGSKQPYSLLAKDCCPITYSSCGTTM